MNSLYKAFYDEMINALDVCKNKAGNYLEQVECCYQVCSKSWGKIKAIAIHYTFKSLTEEIEFYKLLKPSFTSEIEYYGLVYHAELFKPAGAENLLEFFIREERRLKKFIDENKSFYSYYKSGRTDKDEEYFTRADEDLINFSHTRVYDIYDSVVSRYDHIVTAIISLEKYNAYVRMEMEKISDRS